MGYDVGRYRPYMPRKGNRKAGKVAREKGERKVRSPYMDTILYNAACE